LLKKLHSLRFLLTILTLDAQMIGWSETLMQGAEILHVDTQDQAVA